MAEVGIAWAGTNFNSLHPVTMILVIVNDIFSDGTGKTRPSTARRKLILGKEERLPSRNVYIDPLFKGLVIGIVERTLCRTFLGDSVLLLC